MKIKALIRSIITALLVCVFVSPSFAQTLPSAISRVESADPKDTRMTAGDVVVLTVVPPPGVDGDPEFAEKLKEGPVEWGAGRALWWKPADPTTREIKIGLTTYKPGAFEILPIKFVQGGKEVFVSEKQQIQFQPVGGAQQKDDLYPPVAVSFPQWVWILLGLISLAIVIGGIYALARWSQNRKKNLEELASSPKKLNPLEEFEKRKSDIEYQNYTGQGKFKPHYFGLSEASKVFLGKSYRFDAEERTTRELVAELTALGMDSNLVARWKDLFDEMDVTKFTDQIPDENLARSLSSRLSDIVNQAYKLSPYYKEQQLTSITQGNVK